MNQDGGLPDECFFLLTQNEVPTRWVFSALMQQKERLGSADFCVARMVTSRFLGIPLIEGEASTSATGANSPLSP